MQGKHTYPLPDAAKDLPDKFGGCPKIKSFTMQHVLQCKFRGLVMRRHNEFRNSLSLVGKQASFSYSIYNQPIIYKIWYITEI